MDTDALKGLLEKALDGDVCYQEEFISHGSELIASAERVKVLEAALRQASFCLSELLPDNSDAQLTVRVIDKALGDSK